MFRLLVRSLLGTALALTAHHANALPIFGTSDAPFVPDVVVDFGTTAPSPTFPITNQFASDGVEFSVQGVGGFGWSNFGSLTFDNETAGFLGTLSSPGNIYSISFLNPVQAAGFHLRTDPGTTTFTALLGGSVVDSFSAPTFFTFSAVSANFYGFQSLPALDEIQFQINAITTALNLDNVKYATAIPEPSTVGLFGIGLAGLGLMGWRTRRRQRGNHSAYLTATPA